MELILVLLESRVGRHCFITALALLVTTFTACMIVTWPTIQALSSNVVTISPETEDQQNPQALAIARADATNELSDPSQNGMEEKSPVDLPLLQDPDLLWEQQQAARKAKVASVCAHEHASVNLTRVLRSLKHLIADDHHQVLYCFVPKVGCTSWKSALLALNSDWDKVKKVSRIHNREFLQSKGLTSLELMSVQEATKRIKEYRKFMFVREPLERQISAYRDKLEGAGEVYFTRKDGRKIVRLYRQHPSRKALLTGMGVTYPEFVQYVLDGHRDMHWVPYRHLCYPCAIHYDYIGKYETFDEDNQHILKRLFNKTAEEANNFFQTMNANPEAKTSNTEGKYLSQISLQNVLKLTEYYKEDYDMFEYDADSPINIWKNSMGS